MKLLLLILFVATAHADQRVAGEAGPATLWYQDSKLIGSCPVIMVQGSDFVLAPIVGQKGKCVLKANDQVSHFAGCLGDVASEHCGIDQLTGKILFGQQAVEISVPWGTTNPGAPGVGPTQSACNPGATRALQGIALDQDKACFCYQATCNSNTDCGAAPLANCTNNRCTAGTASTVWKCVNVN